jgi:hypothetical protein
MAKTRRFRSEIGNKIFAGNITSVPVRKTINCEKIIESILTLNFFFSEGEGVSIAFELYIGLPDNGCRPAFCFLVVKL